MVVSVNNLVIYIAYSNRLLLHNNIVQEKKKYTSSAEPT